MGEMLPGSWDEVKRQILRSWNRLTEEDLSRVEGDWERLSEKLQSAYGYSKEKAEEEIRRFRRKPSPS